MDPSKDIIGVAKELQGRMCQCHISEPCIRCRILDGSGQDIAQALLDREWKLNTAIHALENEAKIPDHACWIDEALSRIRSLPIE